MIWSLIFNLNVWMIKITHIILIASAIGLFSGSIFSRVPFVKVYGRSIQWVSLFLLVTSIFLEGYFFASKSWLEKVKEYQDKITVAEQQVKDTNSKLDEKSKDLQKQITDNKKKIQTRIVEKRVIIDADCKVNKEAVKILNDAADGVKK